MSRPKNSTTLQKSQQELLTRSTEFAQMDGEDRNPFAVQGGIPAEEALNMAYGLLDTVVNIANAGIDRNPNTNDVVAMRFLSSAAQALVLSCVTAIEQGGAA